MNKIILATTALVSVAFAGSALAQESMVMGPQGASASLGGFYQYRYTDYSESAGVSAGDAEIFISFSQVTDNGLEFGVDWQLQASESNGNTDAAAPENNVDEASMYIGGAFGRVVLGENDSASDSFQTWAPTHAGTIGQDDATNFGGWAGNASYGDDSKIAYFSPNINGFTFGVSWEEALKVAEGQPSNDDSVTFGAAYAFDLADDVDLTVRLASFDDGEIKSEKESLAYGLTANAYDFSFTAANVDYDARVDKTGKKIDNLLGLGIGYTVNDQLAVGAYRSEQGDNEWNSLSAQYTIAPGLTATVARNGKETNAADEDELIFEVGVSF